MIVVRVPLSLGMEALVEEVDAPLVRQFRWHLSTNGYGAHSLRGGGKVTIHRFILSAPEGMDVDHRNGDRLDCRRENMRLCGRPENRANVQTMATSQFLGVYRRFVRDGWFVMANRGVGQWYCGDYSDEIEAAKAHDQAVRYFGRREARTNFDGDDACSPRELLTRNGQCQRPESMYRGVSRSGGVRSYRWGASISVSRKVYRLGHFDAEDQAARMYDAAVVVLLGDRGLGRLNFPGEKPEQHRVEAVAGLVEAGNLSRVG